MKKIITINRKTEDYECKVCKRMVHVALAKPITLETPQATINSWDYGHQHKRTIEFVNGKAQEIEVE